MAHATRRAGRLVLALAVGACGRDAIVPSLNRSGHRGADRRRVRQLDLPAASRPPRHHLPSCGDRLLDNHEARDNTDCARQRNLSAAGRRQARHRQGVPCAADPGRRGAGQTGSRTRDPARLAFGCVPPSAELLLQQGSLTASATCLRATSAMQAGERTRGEVRLEECPVDESNRIGPEGGGAAIFRSSMSWERACLSAQYLGVMDRHLDEVMAFAKERRQFGKALGRH
jgi:hypothetical protein